MADSSNDRFEGLPGVPQFGTVLIEGETLLRSSLAKVIHSNERFRLLGDFDQVELARQGCARLNPSLVIIDIDFAREESLDLIKVIVRERPGTKVLALSGSKDPEVSFRLAEVKVHGFVAKDELVDVLEEAMTELTQGHSYLPAAFIRNCERFSAQDDVPRERLSGTELAILRGVASGRTSRQIAHELRLSPRSVETYRSRILRKLRVPNAAALVEYALRNGLAKPAIETALNGSAGKS